MTKKLTFNYLLEDKGQGGKGGRAESPGLPMSCQGKVQHKFTTARKINTRKKRKSGEGEVPLERRC